MVAVLHLLKGGDLTLAEVTIGEQVKAGHRVEIALLHGSGAPDVPAGVVMHRVPDDLTYEALLEKIFRADHVVTW